MKKSSRKFGVRLKVLSDGSAYLLKEHLWKGWIPLTNKDINSHSVWKDESNSTNQLENQKSYITNYAKKFNKKQNSTVVKL